MPEHTRKLKLLETSPTPQVVFILIDLPKPTAVLLVFLIISPMFFGAMSWPTTIRAFELDRLWLSLGMGMKVVMRRGAYRTWCKRLDCLPPRTNCWKW